MLRRNPHQTSDVGAKVQDGLLNRNGVRQRVRRFSSSAPPKKRPDQMKEEDRRKMEEEAEKRKSEGERTDANEEGKVLWGMEYTPSERREKGEQKEKQRQQKRKSWEH